MKLLLIIIIVSAQTPIEMKLQKDYITLTNALASYVSNTDSFRVQKNNGYFGGWARWDSTAQDSSAGFDSLSLEYLPIILDKDSVGANAIYRDLGTWRKAKLSTDGSNFVTWITNFDNINYEVLFDAVPVSAEWIRVKTVSTVDDSGGATGQLLPAWR